MRAVGLWLAVALLVRGLAAGTITLPGYADAGYAFHVAASLLAGRGLTEDVVWNHLSGPLVLPRPSNAYWPPGPALFAAAGAVLLPDSLPLWRRTQALPVLGAAVLVAATYRLALRAHPRPAADHQAAQRRAATAAALVLGGGISFPYWVTTDSFTPYALAGGACLWLAARATGRSCRAGRALFVSGLMAGFAQWVRADGLLLLVAPLYAACRPGRPEGTPSSTFGRIALPLIGAAAGVAPLVLRALLTWGTPVPPGAGAALWLTAYDDLFRFADPPGLARWLGAGPAPAVAARAGALLANLGVLGQAVLYWAAPLAVLGAWQGRREACSRVALVYLLAVYLLMSLVFPFQGVRGGLFHSLAALAPWIAFWTADGLRVVVSWGAGRRGWPEGQAQGVFAGALAGLTLLAGLYFAADLGRRWDDQARAYAAAGAWLAANAPPQARLMAADPPGMWYATGRPVVATPTDGAGALFEAAAAYRVAYVLLQPYWPPYLAPVYDGETDLPGLEHVADAGALRIYRVSGTPSRRASSG